MQTFLGILLGPVFAKEMIEIARRIRYYINRVVYGLAFLLALFFVWAENSGRLQKAGQNIKVMAQVAEEMFIGVSVVQFGAVFLFVPLFLCGTIASEREDQTLEMLLTTRLRDREIVLGKLLSRIVVFVLLIGCALPVISIISFFGGVDPDSIWRVMVVTLMAVVYTAGHAIYFSTVTKSPIGALIRTYWWMALWIVGLPLAGALVLEAARARFQLALGLVIFVNPIGPMAAAVYVPFYNSMASYLGPWFFPLTMFAPTTWSSFLIWRAVCRLRRPTTPVRFWFWVNIIPGLRRLLGWFRRQWSRFTAWVPARVDRAFNFIRVENPLWLRARQARVYDREGYIGRIQLGAWLAVGFFMVVGSMADDDLLTEDEGAMAFLTPCWIGVASLVALMSASSFVGDRRRGFLDLVLMTPLTGRQIFDGTLLAVWEHVKRIFWLPVALCGLFLFVGETPNIGLVSSLLSATLSCGVLLLFGATCSLAANSLAGAILPTFIFGLFINLGTVIFMGVFRTASGPVLWATTGAVLVFSWFWCRFSSSPAAVATFLGSIYLAIAELGSFWTWRGLNDNRFAEYPIAAMHPGFIAITVLQKRPEWWFRPEYRSKAAYIILAHLIGMALSCLMLRWWTLRNFQRLSRRL